MADGIKTIRLDGRIVKAGANVVAAPAEAGGGGWVAVCDDVDQIRKW
jgi:predicted enzyme related to lactoylglutathione lyase